MKAISKITIYRNRLPARGVRVALEYTGWFTAGFTSNYYTNEEGVALIEHETKGKAIVYVNGREEGRMRVPGSEVYYL